MSLILICDFVGLLCWHAHAWFDFRALNRTSGLSFWKDKEWNGGIPASKMIQR